MHHLDLGLFNYQVAYTRVLLKELCGQIAVDELDNHLAKILRFPGLKIFKNDLENIKQFTANKFQNMMKFVTRFSKYFDKFLISLSEFRLPKLHNWCYHIIKTIREYGEINRFTTKTYEFLHKDTVKIPYRSSNKRDLTDQMIKSVGITATYMQTKNSNEYLTREALTVLEYFLESLNEFLDLCEGLTDNETINISWYSYASISSSGNYIRAKSLYYNEPSFSDMSISMSKEESEDYNTAKDGA
ncbi:hypothetical protein RhiirA4_476349 [Rhizophagus irregularis]|uniref:Uncharacterized protein n=1 Tax=Rhizophagus irregularis TaxID=588596 RepID=A0A2I1HBF6_9GLOM|nr:hypothetical protein RhiirA4_476349 [Rhizophagus irregularis]